MTTKQKTDKDIENRMIDGQVAEPSSENVNAVLNVSITIRVVMGRAEIPLGALMDMPKGAVIELDRHIGDKVDIELNGKIIAHGKLVEMADDKVGVELTEIVKEPSAK